MMPRLFIAIDFPESVKQAAKALQTEIPGARWVDAGNMHLTLRFLGDVDETRVEAIKRTLGEIDLPAFDVTVQGVGCFPENKKKAPRVLWIGMAPQPALNQLQEAVEAKIVALGFPAEDKPFSPHITLARMKTRQPSPKVDAFLEDDQEFALPPFHVNQFYLVSSILSPRGAKYTHEAAFSLREG